MAFMMVREKLRENILSDQFLRENCIYLPIVLEQDNWADVRASRINFRVSIDLAWAFMRIWFWSFSLRTSLSCDSRWNLSALVLRRSVWNRSHEAASFSYLDLKKNTRPAKAKMTTAQRNKRPTNEYIHKFAWTSEWYHQCVRAFEPPPLVVLWWDPLASSFPFQR